MSQSDLRAPLLHASHLVLADGELPWLEDLEAAVMTTGLAVQRAPRQEAALAAFLSGAAAVVLVPTAQQQPEDLWLSLVERAPRTLPIAAVVLPAERRGQAAQIGRAHV